ncbi:MAG: 2'-5' RNA ligase family protein [Anaerolineae bacterium]|jgi:2'-5' RNA ligase
MPGKTVQTALVLVPPREVWPPIQAIRAEYDRNVRRWMPHITLLYPFRPRVDWGAVLGPLSEVCAQTEPFTITLDTFDCFRHGRNATLWLAPEPKARLIALQTALWRAVPDCDDTRKYSGGFTPHLSVGQATDTRADSLIAALQEGWEPITFVAAEVQLIWRGDQSDDVFRIGERLALGRAG